MMDASTPFEDAPLPDRGLRREDRGLTAGSWLKNRYRLIEQIDKGGQGTVWKACGEPHPQAEPLAAEADRLPPIVAIKFYSLDSLCPEEIREREFEATLLESLDHPSLVRYWAHHRYRVPDGQLAAGHQFLLVVMELIEPRASLGEFGATQPLRNRIEQLLPAIDVLGVLHPRLVHRDLKPSNILVQVTPQGLRTVLIDFGSFRNAEFTAHGESKGVGPVGTWEYMSPEQVQSRIVGEKADIWSLGVILFELITGRLPFGTAYEHREGIKQRIAHDPIPTEILRDAGCQPVLERIVGRCLEKHEELRWSARDLARHLRGFLAQGDAYTVPEVTTAQRWRARWKRVPARVKQGMAIMLLVLLAMTGHFNVRLHLAYEREVGLRQRSETAQRESERAGYRGMLQRHELSRERGEFLEIEPVPEWLAGWETDWLRHEAQFRPGIVSVMADHDWPVLDIAVHRNGVEAVTCGADGQLLLSDLNTGHLVRTLAPLPGAELSTGIRLQDVFCNPPFAARSTGEIRPSFCAATWLGDTNKIVAVSLTGTAWLFDLDRSDARQIMEVKAFLTSVTSDASGERVALGGRNGILVVGPNTANGAAQQLDTETPVTAVVRGPNDRGWIVATEDGWLQCVDDQLAVRDRVRVPGPIWSLDLAQDGAMFLLAVGVPRPSVLLFRVTPEAGEILWHDSVPISSPEGSVAAVHAVRLAADAGRLLALDDAQGLTALDLSSRRVLWRCTVSARNVPWRSRVQGFLDRGSADVPILLRRWARLALVPGTEDWVSAGEDVAVVRWTSSGQTGITELPADPQPRLAFSDQSGQILWTAGEAGILRAFDVVTKDCLAEGAAHRGDVTDLTALPRSDAVATVGRDRFLRLWQLKNRGIRKISAWEHSAPLRALAISPNGEFAATTDVAGCLSVWNLKTQEQVLHRQMGNGDQVLTGRLAFNHDGTRLAVFSVGQTSFLLSVPDFRTVNAPRLDISGSGGTALAWTPTIMNGLMFADDQARVILCNTRTGGKQDHAAQRLAARTEDLALSADHRRMFVLESQKLHVLETEQWHENLSRTLSHSGAKRIAVNRHGTDIAIGFADEVIQLWQPLPGTRRLADEAPADAIEWSLTTQQIGDYFVEVSPIVTGSAGRQGLLLLEKRGSDPRPVGELVYVSETDGHLQREPIDPGVAVETEAFVLSASPTGRVAAVYRVRLPDSPNDSHNGELRVAFRKPSGQWDRSGYLMARGNVGFWPLPIWSGEDVRHVFHYSFASHSLIFSDRTSSGHWESKPVGRWGDGYYSTGLADAYGAVHLFFSAKGAQALAKQPIHFRWQAGSADRNPVAGGRGVRVVATGPDGRIRIVTAGSPHGPSRRCELGALDAAGEWSFEPIPGTGLLTDPLACRLAPTGDVWIVMRDRSEGGIRLRVWHREHGRWRVSLIRDNLAETSVVEVALDESGNPLVVLVEAGNERNNAVSFFRGMRAG
jgi:serine/threonine protein kinase/WD40 repeat protein